MQPHIVSTVLAATFFSLGGWCGVGAWESWRYAYKVIQPPSGGWGLFVFGPFLALGEFIWLRRLAIVLVIVGALAIIIGFGLLLYRNWARRGAILFSVIGGGLIGLALLGLLGVVAELDTWWIAAIPMGWSGVVVWYYLRPSVKASFQENDGVFEWSMLGSHAFGSVILAAVFCVTPARIIQERQRQEAQLDQMINAGLPDAARAVPHLIKSLKDNNPETRRMAAVRLGRIGPRASAAVEPLAAALNDADLFVQREAALALGSIGPAAQSAVPDLKVTYRRGNWQLQPQLLTALANIGDQTTLPFLFDVAMSRTSSGSAFSSTPLAIGALARFGAPAVPWLIKALEQGDGDTQYTVCSMLQHMGPQAEAAIPALIQVADGVDRRVTLQALGALESILCLTTLGSAEGGRAWHMPSGQVVWRNQLCSVTAQADYLGPTGKRLIEQEGVYRIQPMENVDHLGTAMAPTTKTESVQSPAQISAWQLQMEQALVDLQALHPTTVADASQVFQDRRSKAYAEEFAPRITPLLKHQRPEVRSSAIYALMNLGAVGYAQEMVPLLEDPAESVRRDARIAVKFLKAKGMTGETRSQVSSGLSRQLNNPNPEIRSRAIQMMGTLGTEGQAETIAAGLRDADLMVRRKAIQTLQRLKATEYAPQIATCLTDKDDGVRGFAAKALAEFGAHEYAPQIAQLLRDKYTSLSAILALLKLGAQEQAQELIPLLSDEKADIRASAAYALGQLGTKEYASQVGRLLTDTSEAYLYDGTKAIKRTTVQKVAEQVFRNWGLDPTQF